MPRRCGRSERVIGPAWPPAEEFGPGGGAGLFAEPEESANPVAAASCALVGRGTARWGWVLDVLDEEKRRSENEKRIWR